MQLFCRKCASLVTVGLLCFVLTDAAAAKLRLQVLGLQPGGRFGINQVYNGLGCKGRNLSPALRIAGIPAKTRSLAITIFDPDVANQSGWWQWLVYDLPATTTYLAQGAGNTRGSGLPRGAHQGPNDYSAPNYGGPCPPAGARAHRYRVTLWALRARTLAVSARASAALISVMIERSAISHQTVIVPYGRP